MATIRKREGKRGISYEVQVKVRDVQSGELKVKATTWKPPSDLTKKQVEKELTLFAMNYEKEMQDLINCGSSSEIENPNTTFKEYAEKWLERAKPNISVNYYANSLTSIDSACQYIGGYKLKDLNPRIIQNFYDKLDKLEKVTYHIVAKDSLRTVITKKKLTYSQLRYGDTYKCGAIDAAMNHKSISMKSAARIAEALNVDIESIFDIETTRQPYAYETIHKIKRTVRTVLSSAKRQRLIVDNWATAEYITFGARPPHEVVCMEEDDAKQFYKGVMAYPELKCKTAALLFLMTGFRLGELCGLEWSDIDFDKQTIRVARSISSVAGFGVILKEPKTESSKRTIRVTSDVIETLKEYKAWQDDYAMQLGDQWIDLNRLFTQLNGDRVNPTSISSWIDKVLKASGLPHWTSRSLRHTNITLQIVAGVPITAVAGRAGHARTSTTTDIYAKFTQKANIQAADTLYNLLQE